jgi:hypothetical protein
MIAINDNSFFIIVSDFCGEDSDYFCKNQILAKKKAKKWCFLHFIYYLCSNITE